MRVFHCKSCNRSFSENSVITRELPHHTAKKYLTGFTSLKSMVENMALDISKTTLHRRIIALSNKAPDWYEVSKSMKEEGKWGFIMGIDTSGLKIKGKNYVYLHVADIPSKDDIAYDVCNNEDTATVKPILRQLRNIGYMPKIVVLDLAQELLTSVKEVFPCAIIQGCVFHVRLWLEKELPTRKTTKKFGIEKVELYAKVKELINYACISKDEDTRQQLLRKLECLNLDEKAKKVVELFLANLKYYHTLDDEDFKCYGTFILYNNLCERHIGLVKDLKNKMKGFKSFGSARNIIKLFWYYARRDSAWLAEQKEDTSAYCIPEREDISRYNIPLSFYFDDPANLALFSKVSGVPREILYKAAQAMGRITIGDYAFTGTKLGDIQDRISKMTEKSFKLIMQEIGCDQAATVELLHKFGFKVMYKSFDASGMVISS